MGFADLLEEAGGVGVFQLINMVLLALPFFMLASHNVIQNFSAAIPEHHCKVQLHCNYSHCVNLTVSQIQRLLIPLDNQKKLEKCLQFPAPQWDLLNMDSAYLNMTSREMVPCKDGWTYDTSEYSSTIVSEWDLVCESRSLKEIAQTVYMSGVLGGGIIFGQLSDRFGRRTVLLWSNLQMAVAGTCAAYSPLFALYCVFRFLTGMALSGIILNVFSLNIEWIPSKIRVVTCIGLGYCHTFGQLILAGYAYKIREWHRLQLIASAPFYFFFLYTWWIPESARWLVLNKKSKEAVKQLKRVTKLNGRPEVVKRLTPEVIEANMEKEIKESESSYRITDVLRRPGMRRITCCLLCTWFSTSFSFYGLAMDLQGFGASVYLMQVVFGVVDIPFNIISLLLISLIGRRFTQASSLIFSGVSILANIFVPKEMQVMRISFAVFGKGCVSGAFICAYLYTLELYPTVIRQTGLGFVSTMARLGAMVAPLVKLTGDYASFLPLLIYGTAPIITGIVVCFLPETRNTQIPDTIEEAEDRLLIVELLKPVILGE
ncbi:solute carrier family 22 member 6-B-like [Protopterus annectens]|uniref:solute carrier family 22 member 6-B-like n=1 Tax=Protopterus annectens TaxID=7888 RepID=UPI001CFBF37F|nr:solute carrier family 22 member 6-B-like [Protopterus annectens]